MRRRKRIETGTSPALDQKTPPSNEPMKTSTPTSPASPVAKKDRTKIGPTPARKSPRSAGTSGKTMNPTESRRSHPGPSPLRRPVDRVLEAHRSLTPLRRNLVGLVYASSIGTALAYVMSAGKSRAVLLFAGALVGAYFYGLRVLRRSLIKWGNVRSIVATITASSVLMTAFSWWPNVTADPSSIGEHLSWSIIGAGYGFIAFAWKLLLWPVHLGRRAVRSITSRRK